MPAGKLTLAMGEKEDARGRLWPYLLVLSVFAAEFIFLKSTGVHIREGANWYLILPNVILLSILLIINDVRLIGLLFVAYPFQFELPQATISIVTFNIYTIGIILLAVVAAARSILRGAREPYNADTLDVIILVLCVQFFFTTITAPDVKDAGYLAFHALFIPVLSYVVLKTRIRTYEAYNELMVVFIGALAVFSALCLKEFAHTHVRIWSPLEFPIAAATVLYWGVVILLYENVTQSKAIRWLLLLLFFSALAVTYARAYLLVAAVSPYLYRTIRRRKGRQVIGLLMVTGCALTLAATTVDSVLSSKQDTQLRRQANSAARVLDSENYIESIARRGDLWHYGMEDFWRSPLIGTGYHSAVSGGRIAYHNNYIEWLAYGGVLGFLLQVYIYTRQYRRFDRRSRGGKLIAANLTALTGVLANAFANGLTHGIMPTVAFMLLGLNEALFRLEKAKAPPVPENEHSVTGTENGADPVGLLEVKSSNSILHRRGMPQLSDGAKRPLKEEGGSSG